MCPDGTGRFVRGESPSPGMMGGANSPPAKAVLMEPSNAGVGLSGHRPELVCL